jgi:hypothetical protein
MAAQRAVYCFRVASKIVPAVQVGTLIRSESQSEKGPGNVELEQIQFLLGHSQSRQRSVTWGCKQRIHNAVNDRIGLEQSKSVVLNSLTSPSSQRNL